MRAGTSDASLYQNRLPQLASRLSSVLEASALGLDTNGILSEPLQGLHMISQRCSCIFSCLKFYIQLYLSFRSIIYSLLDDCRKKIINCPTFSTGHVLVMIQPDLSGNIKESF